MVIVGQLTSSKNLTDYNFINQFTVNRCAVGICVGFHELLNYTEPNYYISSRAAIASHVERWYKKNMHNLKAMVTG